MFCLKEHCSSLPSIGWCFWWTSAKLVGWKNRFKKHLSWPWNKYRLNLLQWWFLVIFPTFRGTFLTDSGFSNFSRSLEKLIGFAQRKERLNYYQVASQIRTNKEIGLLCLKKRNRCLAIYYLRPLKCQKLFCKPLSFSYRSRSHTDLHSLDSPAWMTF